MADGRWQKKNGERKSAFSILTSAVCRLTSAVCRFFPTLNPMLRNTNCRLLFCFLVCCQFALGSRAQNATQPDPYSRPALVIVDMQNDFVRQGAPMEVPDARNTIEQNKQLLELCRKAGIPVIFTRFIATDDPSLLWNWSPKIAPPLYACKRGYQRSYPDINKKLECIAVIDELAPLPSEIIIDKNGYGAFHHTSLDSVLKKLGVESILLTGTVTQICVEETGREAFHHGYKTTMITDAVSSFAPDLHTATIRNFAMKFGWTKTTAEVVQKLKEIYAIR